MPQHDTPATFLRSVRAHRGLIHWLVLGLLLGLAFTGIAHADHGAPVDPSAFAASGPMPVGHDGIDPLPCPDHGAPHADATACGLAVGCGVVAPVTVGTVLAPTVASAAPALSPQFLPPGRNLPPGLRPPNRSTHS